MVGYTGVLGPVLLSIFVNTYLSGLVGFQYALFQALKYKKSLAIRLTVLSMYALDIFQIVIVFYMIWLYCVTHYIDPSALDSIALWVFTSIPLCGSLSSFITHVFMTHRISVFTTRRLPLAVLAAASLAVLILGLSVGAYGIAQDISMIDVIAGASSYRNLLVAWFAARLALDFVMLGTMACVYLHQGPNYLNHIQLPIIRNGLISIQCGSLTTLFSVCILITFLASPKTTTYVIFLLPSGRLYSNIVLTTINSLHPREIIRADPNDIITKDIWAVNPITRTSFAQSISLEQMRTEQEVIIGRENEDAASISSRPSTTNGLSGPFKRDDKKPEGLLEASHDDDGGPNS